MYITDLLYDTLYMSTDTRREVRTAAVTKSGRGSGGGGIGGRGHARSPQPGGWGGGGVPRANRGPGRPAQPPGHS